MGKRSWCFLVGLVGLVLFVAALAFEKTPKRCAVFAGYNREGIVSPYVLTYLKALNEVAPECVVYITDSELKEGEEKKLEGLSIHQEHQRHNEYDWGSYKRGFNWLKDNGKLEGVDELILANDSCYAPLGGSFKPMFEKMAKREELDFWGDSQNTAFHPHVQSYFMVFRKKVIGSRSFATFLNNVRHQAYSSYYIQLYETTLTPLLTSMGYKWDSYIDYARMAPFLKRQYHETDINVMPLTAIKDFNHLFLKRRTFTNSLAIFEDRQELLRYIARYYPKNYQDIAVEIDENYIPEELRREGDVKLY